MDTIVLGRLGSALMPLGLAGTVLTVASHFLAGHLSIGLLTTPQLLVAGYFTACFALLFSLILVLDSVRSMRHHIDVASGRLDIGALWREEFRPEAAVIGCSVVFCTILALGGNANLVQIYRSSTTIWYDHWLWQLEQPLFQAVVRFRLLPLSWWETTYQLMWIYVLLALAVLVKQTKVNSYITLALGIVLAFYGTTAFALCFPVAGPEYYRPNWFGHLHGTITAQLQADLLAYQTGHLAQNGLLYGTMAMPSLHVAMTAMATWAIGNHWPRTLWYTVPASLLIWASTIVLAWHYALDGVAALVLSWLCIKVSQRLVDWCEQFPLTRHAHSAQP